MMAHSAVLGDAHIGNNVIFSFGSMIMNEDVPDNSIVFGRSPDAKIVTIGPERMREKIAVYWREAERENTEMDMVTKEDVQAMLGEQEDLSALANIDKYDLSYHKLGGAEAEREILQALKRIQTDTQVVGTPERTTVWEKGWGENLREFADSLDIADLMPKYFRPDIAFRWQGHLVKSPNPRFEYELGNILKQCLYELYASDVSDIYEFGCGTGYNLVQMGQMFPKKHLHGLDLTESGIRVLSLLREKLGIDVDGQMFDFTKPDESLRLNPNSLVFTSAALEQIGDRCRPFVDFLMGQSFKRCVHLEPIVELYDEDDLLDYLAKSFHQKRHYLSGLLPYLQELEAAGKVTIEKIQRTHLGNFNHEGYTILVWHKTQLYGSEAYAG